MEKYTGRIHVECYAGSRGEEEPRAIVTGKTRVAVDEIVDRWLDPAHRYFKVRGSDGNLYMLRHDEASGGWELCRFAPP